MVKHAAFPTGCWMSKMFDRLAGAFHTRNFTSHYAKKAIQEISENETRGHCNPTNEKKNSWQACWRNSYHSLNQQITSSSMIGVRGCYCTLQPVVSWNTAMYSLECKHARWISAFTFNVPEAEKEALMRFGLYADLKFWTNKKKKIIICSHGMKCMEFVRVSYCALNEWTLNAVAD